MHVTEYDYYAAVDAELAQELEHDAERDAERDKEPPCHRDPADAAAHFCGCWR